MLGFDAELPPSATDAELAERSAREGRILLTRDVGLLKRSQVERGAFVRATDPAAQLREVVDRFDLRPLFRPFTRCLRCNTPLVEATPAQVEATGCLRGCASGSASSARVPGAPGSSGAAPTTRGWRARSRRSPRPADRSPHPLCYTQHPSPMAATDAEAPLQGLNRWVTGPSLVGGLIGAGLSLLYGNLTLRLLEGTRVAFTLIALLIVTLLTLLGDAVEQAGLRTLRAIGERRLPATEENLGLAAREASQIAGRSFGVNLTAFVFGAGLVGLIYKLFPGVSWTITFRLGILGALFGPIAAVLIYLMITRRARVLIERLAAQGLGFEALRRAIPPRDFRLRRRLVLFTALSALAPTLLIADVSLSRAEDALEAAASGLPAPDHDHSTRELVITVLLVALTIGVVLGSARLSGTVIGEPVLRLTAEAARITEGDLRAGSVIPAEDEFWGASLAFTAMQTQLSSMLARLKQAGAKVGTNAERLVASTSEQQAGTAEQVPALHETTATTEELARSAAQIAENAQAVAVLAARTLSSAKEGQSNSAAFFSAMARLRQDSQAVADSVVRLNKRVQQIGKVVQFITEIADKSDLLALNAELEGTKAGELGRGFSLVASEMRRLAEHVISSTGEIQRLIEEIRDGTQTAVMATESGMKATDLGAAIATRVSSGLEQIYAMAQRTSDAVRAISLATQQQQTGTDQLAVAMSEILGITQRGADATAKLSTANQSLDRLARDLNGLVERLRV